MGDHCHESAYLMLLLMPGFALLANFLFCTCIRLCFLKTYMTRTMFSVNDSTGSEEFFIYFF